MPTIGRYLDVFTDLFLVRTLRPWSANKGKRLIKSPKVYLRDSGILHALLSISSYEELLSHPVIGNSWEGFVIENIASVVGQSTNLWYYRTAAGAEIDLIIEYAPAKLIAIEIKRSISPVPSRGFHTSLVDLSPEASFIVHPGTERYRISNNTEVISLPELMKTIADLSS